MEKIGYLSTEMTARPVSSRRFTTCSGMDSKNNKETDAVMKHWYVYIIILILSLSILLSSCGNNNDNEPPLEIRLPISEVYVPVSVEFNEKEISQEDKSQLIHLVNNQFVINDVSEIPDDPLGLNDTFGVAFDKVNFNEYTLLIKYIINDWTIDSYNNRYYRNTQENTYNWSINIGTASDTEHYRFTRFAILVKKLPTDAKVVIWQGLTQLG